MEIQKFKDQLIAFDPDSDMVNATDLLKAFNKDLPAKRKAKTIGDYIRLKSTKEFINVLESDMGIPVSTVTKGGQKQGTWMHRLLAYDFAAWLSPEFRMFVYKVFDNVVQEKIKHQQKQLDYFWDKEDQNDLYPKWK